MRLCVLVIFTMFVLYFFFLLRFRFDCRLIYSKFGTELYLSKLAVVALCSVIWLLPLPSYITSTIALRIYITKMNKQTRVLRGHKFHFLFAHALKTSHLSIPRQQQQRLRRLSRLVARPPCYIGFTFDI